MKKQLLCIAFVIPALFAESQEITTSLLKNGTGGFKFVRTTAVESRAGEWLDTVEIYFHPESWQDSARFREYLLGLIHANDQGQEDLQRALRREADAGDFYAAALDSVFGPGSFLALQKQKVLEQLQGSWRLIEKDAGAKILRVDGFDATLPGRAGQLTITDDLKAVFTGLQNIPLEFSRQPNGWRAVRKTASRERVFLLRR